MTQFVSTMPFPLAHPAAVFPLRRFCPRYLSLPALIAGSLAPDVAYIFGDKGLSDISHELLGGMCFGLIVGMLMLWLFYGPGRKGVSRLPRKYQETLLPVFQQPAGTATVVVISLLLGTATHLVLDSFTHTHGWLVNHFSVLQSPVFMFMGRQVKLCHLLWYVCSFVGVAWLVVALRDYQANHKTDHQYPIPVRARVLEALFVSALVLPIELLHHVVRSRLGLAVVGALTLALAVGVLCRVPGNRRSPDPRPVL